METKTKLIRKWLILFLMFAILFLMFPFLIPNSKFQILRLAWAAPSYIESDNYKIQLPGFNSGAGIPSSSNYAINSTIGALAAGLFESTNYKVRSGFQYIHTIIPFSFTISDVSIDFGTLNVGIASTQPSTLTVKAGGAGGYSVKAQENHPLAIDNNPSNPTIADTLCDSGPCSETSAQNWSSASTYGFGFNMSGDDIPADFSGGKYRQFADAASAEDPATIMTKSGVTWDYPNNTWPWESQATITYKVNVSATQEAGKYYNLILFTAIPAF